MSQESIPMGEVPREDLVDVDTRLQQLAAEGDVHGALWLLGQLLYNFVHDPWVKTNAHAVIHSAAGLNAGHVGQVTCWWAEGEQIPMPTLRNILSMAADLVQVTYSPRDRAALRAGRILIELVIRQAQHAVVPYPLENYSLVLRSIQESIELASVAYPERFLDVTAHKLISHGAPTVQQVADSAHQIQVAWDRASDLPVDPSLGRAVRRARALCLTWANPVQRAIAWRDPDDVLRKILNQTTR